MWLTDRMKEFGSQEAVICDGKTSSYEDILNHYETWRHFLSQNRLKPGDVIALVGDFSVQACAAFLALIENKNIIIPLMNTTYAKHPEFLDIAEVEFILQIEPTKKVTARNTKVSNKLIQNLKDRQDAGLVFFSSGSTGKSKAAIHAMAPFLEKFRPRRQALRTLIFFLFDHIGGVNTLLHIFANGGVLIVPQNRQPQTICKIISEQRG